MWKGLLLGTILLAGAGAFGVSRLMWPSPDYAVKGLCSVGDIDQTYAALTQNDAFGQAGRDRAQYEYWAYHPHVRTLGSTAATNFNARIYSHFEKRKTAAYVCNHLTPYFKVSPYFRTFPELVAAIRPMTKTSDDAGRLAVCVYGREAYSPQALRQATIDKLQKTCGSRHS